jgi:AbiV family abortive infection protein
LGRAKQQSMEEEELIMQRLIDLALPLQEMFQNAELHLKIGKVLGFEKSYGMGVAHLILGMEELIKYQVLLIGDEIHGAEIRKIFSDHPFKHNMIFEHQELFTDDFKKRFLTNFFEVMLYEREKNDASFDKAKTMEDIEQKFAEDEYKYNLPFNKKDQFFIWLKNANGLKNHGLYVSLRSKTWFYPKDVTKEQFEESLYYASILMNQTHLIKYILEKDEDFKEYLIKREIKKSLLDLVVMLVDIEHDKRIRPN